MKRKFTVFLALILFSSAFFLFSCKGKIASTGTLSVTAMTKDGAPSPSAPPAIYLATSKENMDNKIYESSGWLDANGSKIFRDLLPKYYWYRVEGWNDVGASAVYAGFDESVILWLNSPSAAKK